MAVLDTNDAEHFPLSQIHHICFQFLILLLQHCGLLGHIVGHDLGLPAESVDYIVHARLAGALDLRK